MADDDEPADSEETESTSGPESEPKESDELRSFSSSVGEEEFKKHLTDEASNRLAAVLSELALGNKVAAVYIDARSGGVFFQGPAQIRGDVAGRDHVQSGKGTTGEGKATVGQILVTDLRKIHAVYVESAAYQAATIKLKEKHLVILQGRAHMGKWTTAVRLLDKLHQGKVVELDPSAKASQLKESIALGRGYVVDNLTVEEVENFTAFSLGPLSEKLRELKSHLVITVDEKKKLPTSIHADYIVVWDPKLDVNQVLEKHLDWYVSNATEDEKKQIQLDEKVRSLLNSDLLPGEIDRLAEALGSVLEKKFDLDAALAHYTAMTLEQVKSWFDENDDLSDRLLMLSVAVFNGASYQVIGDAEKRLKSLFPEGESVPTASSVFGTSRGQRVRRVGAQLKDGFTHNELGRVPVKIVELDNQNIQPAVLRYTWEEFDGLRDILADWLYSSVYEAPFEVRIRAAAAVGELSKLDFNEIRTRIILPWAKDETMGARASAAMALGIPAWHSETAPLVLRLLHHWSTVNNWRLCWTACAAYGGLAGIRFPDAAVRDLRIIGQTGDLRLLGALSQSMKNLFDAGELVSQYRQKVLDELIAWTEKVKSPEGVFGLFIFLFIAQRSWRKADPEGDDWPTVLHLMKEDKLLVGSITELWSRAFNARTSRAAAFSVLEGWLKIVQKDKRLDEECLQLIRGIASGEARGKEGRIRSYLGRWKMKPDTEHIATWILDHM